MERARLAKQWVTSIIPTASRAALVVSQTYCSLIKWLPFVICTPVETSVQGETSSCLFPGAKFPCRSPVSRVVFYLPSVSVQCFFFFFLSDRPKK